jgi:ferredoxin-NADP reductase
VVVTSVTDETPRVRTLQLAVDEWPGHRAGQHVDVRLTAEDGYQAERAYSIASAPGEPLAITVERLDDGEVSPYLTEEARENDRF